MRYGEQYRAILDGGGCCDMGSGRHHLYPQFPAKGAADGFGGRRLGAGAFTRMRATMRQKKEWPAAGR